MIFALPFLLNHNFQHKSSYLIVFRFESVWLKCDKKIFDSHSIVSLDLVTCAGQANNVFNVYKSWKLCISVEKSRYIWRWIFVWILFCAFFSYGGIMAHTPMNDAQLYCCSTFRCKQWMAWIVVTWITLVLCAQCSVRMCVMAVLLSTLLV